MKTKSIARAAQQKHWETMGQISSMMGLCNYISASPLVSKEVKVSINGAHICLNMAFQRETANNQFINLNLPRGF